MKKLLPALLALAVLAAAPGAVSVDLQHLPESRSPDLLEQAAWLEGHWIGDGLGGLNESIWSPPRAGTMMGVFRHLRDGKVVFYELLVLTEREGVLLLSLKHFDPDMRGWEEPEESVDFPLVRMEEDAIHFDGMTWRRTGPDRREVTVMLGPSEEELRPEVFTYRRAGT